MPLGDAYADSTLQALTVMAARPVDPEPPRPKHSAWSTIPRAVAGAFLEVGGNALDTASAFGQVAAAAGGVGPGFAPEDKKQRQQSLEAYDRLKSEGINWRSDEARANYDMARDLRPDPITAGAAEQIVFGMTKGLTKAIGGAVALGNVGGAAAFGLSEGMTTADDLAEQGVDPATRAKVGAVTGALNAAGVALPVAGRTLAQTAGLVAVGGPGSFVAQQMATREILAGADYGELAKQYDPLDPVGLAVSTLVPAGFGAFAMRGAARSAAAGPRARVTPEQLDALMSHNITAHADARPARERAELLRAWDEVHQNPVGPANDPLVRLTPDDVADVLVSRGPVSLKEDGVSIQVPGYGLVKFIWRHGPESGKPEAAAITAEDLADFPVLMREYEPEMTALHDQKTGRTTEQMTWVVDRPDGRRVVYGTTRFLADDEHHLVTVHVDGERKTVPSQKRKEPPTTSGPGTLQASGRDTARESFASSSWEVEGGYEPSIGNRGADVTGAEAAAVDAMRTRIEALKTEQPDLMVKLADDAEPMRMDEALAEIQRRAQEGTDTDFGALDAPLLQVAAECAISFGGAA